MPPLKYIEKHIVVQIDGQQKEAVEALDDAVQAITYASERMEVPEETDYDVIFAELEAADHKLDLARRRMATVRGLRLGLSGVRRAK